jgi:hypothetical protein
MSRSGGIFDLNGGKVTQPSDIQYFLTLDEEQIPLEGTITVGRHLDNELLLAGEDVLDYHLRIEPTDRGPWVVPLGEATLRVNGVDRGAALGLMPGDTLHIGQTEITLQVETLHPPEADAWRLIAARDGEGRPVEGALQIGRGEDNDLVLLDDHISRRHARLETHAGVVWLRDLESANGSFVN